MLFIKILYVEYKEYMQASDLFKLCLKFVHGNA